MSKETEAAASHVHPHIERVPELTPPLDVTVIDADAAQLGKSPPEADAPDDADADVPTNPRQSTHEGHDEGKNRGAAPSIGDGPASRRGRSRMTLRIPDDAVPLSRASSPDLETGRHVTGTAAVIRAMRIIAVGEPADSPTTQASDAVGSAPSASERGTEGSEANTDTIQLPPPRLPSRHLPDPQKQTATTEAASSPLRAHHSPHAPVIATSIDAAPNTLASPKEVVPELASDDVAEALSPDDILADAPADAEPPFPSPRLGSMSPDLEGQLSETVDDASLLADPEPLTPSTQASSECAHSPLDLDGPLAGTVDDSSLLLEHEPAAITPLRPGPGKTEAQTWAVPHAQPAQLPIMVPPSDEEVELGDEDVAPEEPVAAPPPSAPEADVAEASSSDVDAETTLPSFEVPVEIAEEPVEPVAPQLSLEDRGESSKHTPVAPPDNVEFLDVETVEEPRKAPPPAPRPRPSNPPRSQAEPSQPRAEVSKPRIRPWWEELFTDDFVRSMDRLTPSQIGKEVKFIEDSLALQKGGVMLDLACGAGQYAVELAARGYSVVGYDLSLTMLALAADEAQTRGQKLNFLQGDMREMAFDEMFDGVFCWSTSFGYFENDKNVDVLRRVHRSLRHGGMFLLDMANRDFLCVRTPNLAWFEGDGCVCMDEARFDSITSRLQVKRTLMLDDGRSREIDFSIRLYSLHEIGKMLNDTGFRVVEVSGQPATSGVFMGADSPRLITLAEKR